MFNSTAQLTCLPRHSMALPLATAILRGRRKEHCATSEIGAAAVQTAGAAGRETMGEAMDSWRVAQDAQGNLKFTHMLHVLSLCFYTYMEN